VVTLAIDPAFSKQTAYALFNNSTLKLYGKVKRVQDLTMLFNYHPDLIVTEKMYLGKNAKTYGQLSEEVGKIKLLCEIYDIPYRLIPPATWKAHHGLLKQPAQFAKVIEDKILENVTSSKIKDPDIRSAILIGMCHIEQARMGVK
jgi:Holliday junction resolvasome RuvABC endonuclease subunit